MLLGSMNLRWYSWNELDPDALHAILRLRSEVFQLEQKCLFLDLDGRDPLSRHGAIWEEGRCVATVRLTPPGVRYEDAWSFGRLATARTHRGRELGRALAQAALDEIARIAGRDEPVRIFAQSHLEGFYARFGFRTLGEPQEEDGILHLEMIKP